MVAMAMLVMALSAAALVREAQGAACTCPYPVKKVSTKNKITFAVIGDWGRVGGVLSTMNVSMGGYDESGWCSNPANGFADDDTTGGTDQKAAAMAMNGVCAKVGCQFIISTGDNFYECGLDNPIRWKTDFEDVYQSSSTPTIKKLPWYSIIGNHDIVTDGSVDAQIAYGKTNKLWTANRTFAWEVHSSDSSLRLRFGAINTNPFVTKYAKANYKYNTSEFRAYASPQNISSQLAYLEKVLNTSKATYDIVLGHHPVFGDQASNGYMSPYPQDVSNNDLGRKDMSGMGSWQSLLGILRTYNPVAYMNGHEHTLAFAVDAVNSTNWTTSYVITGAGSLPDAACNSAAAYRTNILFSALSVNNTCPGGDPSPSYSNPAGAPGLVGFSLVTATSKSMTLDHYAVLAGKTTKVYSTVLKGGPQSRTKKKSCPC